MTKEKGIEEALAGLRIIIKTNIQLKNLLAQKLTLTPQEIQEIKEFVETNVQGLALINGLLERPETFDKKQGMAP